MKSKIILMLLCASMIFTFAGCKSNESGNEADGGETQIDSWKGYENEDLSKYVRTGDYKGLTYTPVSTAVTDEDLEKEIQARLNAKAVENDITDRASAEGDRVTVSYSCKADGTEISELSTASLVVTLSESNTNKYDIDGLVSHLYGVKAGDTVTIKQEFPEDYTNTKLADASAVSGKTGVFTVTVSKVSAIDVPELTDEFASAYGIESTTVEEYRQEVLEELKKSAEENADITVKKELWSKVLNGSDFLMLPESELKAQRDQMYAYYKEAADYYQIDLSTLISYYGYNDESFSAAVDKNAEITVQSQLVLYSLVKEENITVGDDEYQQELARLASDNGYDSPEALEDEYGKDVVINTIYQEKVLNIILANSIAAEDGSEDTTSAQ